MVGDIIAQAIALLSQGGAPVWAVVLLAVASAVLMVVGRKLGSIQLPPPSPPEPEPPAAEWNQDPSQGAVVVPNDDPGGCGPGGSCAG